MQADELMSQFLSDRNIQPSLAPDGRLYTCSYCRTGIPAPLFLSQLPSKSLTGYDLADIATVKFICEHSHLSTTMQHNTGFISYRGAPKLVKSNWFVSAYRFHLTGLVDDVFTNSERDRRKLVILQEYLLNNPAFSHDILAELFLNADTELSIRDILRMPNSWCYVFPHLFPLGVGHYDKIHSPGTMQQWIKHRLFGPDSRFALDPTFLYFVYSQIE